jgi:hypothetical protein
LPNKAGADAIQREQIALFGRLDRNEVHGGPLHGFGDGLGIAVVVFVSLEKRLDVLSRDQANVVPEWPDLARDMMRASADEGRFWLSSD